MDVEKIAKSLSKEQCDAILTGTGTNWLIPMQTCELGLTDHSFAYTPLGLAVREYLEKSDEG